MKWQSFTLDGTVYSLEHLHPFTFQVVIPAKDEKPEQSYKLRVTFGLHCFTRGTKENEEILSELAYKDNRETRIFDNERYELSKQLPEIIKDLVSKKCFHEEHGNFYVVEIMSENGTIYYYSIFFALSKAGKGKALNLFIISAHLRDIFPYSHNLKPIKFQVLLYNVRNGKSIKPAP